MSEADTLVSVTDGWELSPSVALRPEPFGALAYHFGNRKLTFLKTPALVTLVRALGDAPDVAAAMDAAGVPEQQRPAYLAALTGLARTDMIRPRTEPGSGAERRAS
ncbi:mycofactocin biosynthesis chaperone MftB [Nocardioides sp. DS6]|uniref:Mycofactocin biosynthesis chaperone MftB n=1 Tax=Nocardioides eburneus TaxID=3231482 RepID=A0ABV3SUH3_9ACTN